MGRSDIIWLRNKKFDLQHQETLENMKKKTTRGTYMAKRDNDLVDKFKNS